jgi:hypothetical protein
MGLGMQLLNRARFPFRARLFIGCLCACLATAILLGVQDWAVGPRAAGQGLIPSLAGRSAADWASSGIVLSSPTTTARISAAVAKTTAIARFTGSTATGATLVQMSMPGSQVVPAATYWAVTLTPSAALAAPVGGPAGQGSEPLNQMVVFINAQTGEYVMAQMWN